MSSEDSVDAAEAVVRSSEDVAESSRGGEREFSAPAAPPAKLFPSTQELAVIDDTLPQLVALRQEAASGGPSGLVRTSLLIDFPILSDPEIAPFFKEGLPAEARAFAFPHEIAAEMYYRPSLNGLEGAVAFSYGAMGPPNCVHGGALATALDNLLGWTINRVVGSGHVTIQLNTRYVKFAPLGLTCLFRTKVERTEGRKVFVFGELYSVQDGAEVRHTDAEAIFYCANTKHHKSWEELTSFIGKDSGVEREVMLSELRKRSVRRQERKLQLANGGGAKL